MKDNWKCFGLWIITLFVVIIVSVFLHEMGHGIGATMDGFHVSTGFNKVGMPGKTPDDPDFRTGMPQGVWSGLLGLVTTWVLAILFTIMLYRQQKPTQTSLIVGATAVANGLLRAVPMSWFLVSAMAGQLHMEDEVGWGIWYTVKTFLPDFAMYDFTTLASTQAPALLAYPAAWIPPLFSLTLSLVCLIFAYRQIFKPEGAWLSHWGARLLLVALSLVVWFTHIPVVNALDRVIRINW